MSNKAAAKNKPLCGACGPEPPLASQSWGASAGLPDRADSGRSLLPALLFGCWHLHSPGTLQPDVSVLMSGRLLLPALPAAHSGCKASPALPESAAEQRLLAALDPAELGLAAPLEVRQVQARLWRRIAALLTRQPACSLQIRRQAPHWPGHLSIRNAREWLCAGFRLREGRLVQNRPGAPGKAVRVRSWPSFVWRQASLGWSPAPLAPLQC